MWLVPEAYVVMRHGWRESCCRIENVSILATQVVYFGVVAVFAPAYLEVATGLFGYQDAYASPIPLLNQATKYLLLAVGLTLVFRPSWQWIGLRRILLLNVAVCVAILLIQAKGFRYHYVPIYVASLCLANVIVMGSQRLSVLGSFELRVPVRSVACTLALLGIVATGVHTANVLRYRNVAVEELRRVVATLAPDGPIFIASPNIPPAFPLVNLADVSWTSRYGCQWLVPASYTAEERAADPFP